MKILKYQVMREVNYGTEESPDIVQSFHNCEIQTDGDNYEKNLAIARAEAWDGKVFEEEAAQSKERRIASLKQKLFETDYNILKIVEGASTLVECAEIIARRAAWRREINELEEKGNVEID